jgi:hypothetical protein
MDIAEALQIVLDLARQNIIDFDHEDDDLNAERAKQTEAIKIVEDMAVNQFGDD